MPITQDALILRVKPEASVVYCFACGDVIGSKTFMVIRAECRAKCKRQLTCANAIKMNNSDIRRKHQERIDALCNAQSV